MQHVLAITENGVTDLSCSRRQRITVLTAVVEKAGNAKNVSDAISLDFSATSDAGKDFHPTKYQYLDKNDGNYTTAVFRVSLRNINDFW